MKKAIRTIFAIILVFSCYHLIRDVVQILELNNDLTEIFHRNHQWCGQYCNYVTLPLEIFGIIGSIIILRRNKIGIIGIVNLFSLLLWPIFQFLP